MSEHNHIREARMMVAHGNPLHVAELNHMALLLRQLDRANRIIGWMMPYIGNMCPPDKGLFDLNEHCFENNIPEGGEAGIGIPAIRSNCETQSSDHEGQDG